MQSITIEEAQSLINMLKRYADKKILSFPQPGEGVQFSVIGDTNKDRFAVNVYRQNKNPQGCSFQGRTETDNIILMRLDVNPTAVHCNPDGTKIKGTHLHIYTEEYGSKYATEFNPGNKDLFEICLDFFCKIQYN